MCFAFKEVKTWLKSGAKSLPLPPECTANIAISMVDHVMSTKSSYLAGVLIDALNTSYLPDFLVNRGTFLIYNCQNECYLNLDFSFPDTLDGCLCYFSRCLDMPDTHTLSPF